MSETLKICCTCKLEKPLVEFNKKSSTRDGLERYCKPCHRSRNQQHYRKAKPVYIVNAIRNTGLVTAWFDEIKAQYVCSNCPETRWWCLDFHHTDRNTKSRDISKLRRLGSKTAILAELEKCVPLCRNCHANLHYHERLNSK